MICSLDIDEEVTLVNCNGQPMANGYTCPERTTLHGRPIIDKCVVCEITGVMPNGVALFEDPIERDHSLYAGSYVQWPIAYIHSKVSKINIKFS